jgi:hypothetical protein
LAGIAPERHSQAKNRRIAPSRASWVLTTNGSLVRGER